MVNFPTGSLEVYCGKGYGADAVTTLINKFIMSLRDKPIAYEQDLNISESKESEHRIWLRQGNLKEIFVEIGDDNIASLKLFKKCGFKLSSYSALDGMWVLKWAFLPPKNKTTDLQTAVFERVSRPTYLRDLKLLKAEEIAKKILEQSNRENSLSQRKKIVKFSNIVAEFKSYGENELLSTLFSEPEAVCAVLQILSPSQDFTLKTCLPIEEIPTEADIQEMNIEIEEGIFGLIA